MLSEIFANAVNYLGTEKLIRGGQALGLLAGGLWLAHKSIKADRAANFYSARPPSRLDPRLWIAKFKNRP